MASVAALIDTAKLLTELADKVADEKMFVGYHAHGGDFKPLADRIPWDILFSNAGPGVVMQLDTGNLPQRRRRSGCHGSRSSPVVRRRFT